MIPIATEVEHITNYLKIQQMRYQDKIRFTLDMDRELYPYLTLKSLLRLWWRMPFIMASRTRKGRARSRLRGDFRMIGFGFK